MEKLKRKIIFWWYRLTGRWLEQKRKTVFSTSYWNENAVYNKEISYLWDKLVPSQGAAETMHGELIRCHSRLEYDYYNNGNCNVRDVKVIDEYKDCGDCDGDGEIDYGDGTIGVCTYCEGIGEEHYSSSEEVEINQFYDNMIHFLEFYGNAEISKLARELRSFLLRTDVGYCTYEYDGKESEIYTKLGDAVAWHVLTTKNKPNPEYVKES